MKTLLKSLKLKYLINVLLIISFGITAQTGLFDGGGEHEGRRGHSREESSFIEYSSRSMNEADVIDLISGEGTSSEPVNGKDSTHVYLGLSLLALMLLHTIQHWSWFKKLFSTDHLLKNKLLSITVVFFIAMAVSGIMLWTQVVPRDIINFKEIHEITSQILLGLILIHIVQRFKWYITIAQYFITKKAATA
ncbi:hypothetical protein AQPE_3646 [Aquipluma nitroreducens]|uniref:Flavinylation-associated cytochrome domain-containing protein n=1 Tax=Aquipluma nitroreducens TaxID=2010828 RepID=A0A5K7SCY0_9BACT|nr:DUF4405 domain-containing protein [Aquipluma nitroreducens]BBE19461.1 hypothetical protein AQPE_3646 [Aquipluma nitroreducens]